MNLKPHTLNLKPYTNSLHLPLPSVITVGSFDGVHLGHQVLLQQVTHYAKQNHCQSVLITFDPHPQQVLQTKPDFFLINTLEQKITLFEKMGIDTVVVIPFSKTLSQKSAIAFFEEYILTRINVKAVFMGPNHHFGKQREGNAETLSQLCATNGIEIISTQEYKVNEIQVRSTLIRKYLAQKDFQNAEKLMGHSIYTFNPLNPYSFNS